MASKIGFIILVDEVMIQQVQITVGYFFAVHIFQAVYQQAAVEADKIRFGEFAYQCGDILVLHIGVGIVFAAGSRIGSVAIIEKKVELVPYFPVFQMFLAIQHICLGNAVIMLCHQGDLHLVLVSSTFVPSLILTRLNTLVITSCVAKLPTDKNALDIAFLILSREKVLSSRPF